jgi:hypothetical protein
MSFDKAPHKKSLIKHPPSPSMSERQEARLLSKQLRKLENAEATPDNINLMLRLSQRIGKVRESINKRKNHDGVAPGKRPVGRPKKVKPVEPGVDSLTAVLEAERLILNGGTSETPEPSIVFEHARRAEVKAEMKKEREAVENSPIAVPQTNVYTGCVSDMSHFDGEVIGSVGRTNAALGDFEPHEPVGDGELLSDGFGGLKRS